MMTKKAFIPPHLPPKLDFTPIFPNIIKARDIVARYDEAVKRLPNPEIIQRSFETKEAVLSSKIELFARQKTDGWDVWGNEVKSSVAL